MPMEELSNKKRVRDDSDELELVLPEVKRIRENLLEILDDSDLCTTSHDLDSFMKSFEEEISASSSPAVNVVDLTSESGESQPELGYLLEASDDELGIPPSTSSEALQIHVETELTGVSSDSTKLNELWGFDDQISSYDSFGFGFSDVEGYSNYNGEYVALDGLFDYSDVGFGSSDCSWRSETLPAQ